LAVLIVLVGEGSPSAGHFEKSKLGFGVSGILRDLKALAARAR